jgi:alkaline phosphatase
LKKNRIVGFTLSVILALALVLSGCSADTSSPTFSGVTLSPAAASSAAVSVSVAPIKDTKVKNIILLIGDGMGMGQVTLGRIANGNKPLNLDGMAYTGYVSTYPDDSEHTFVTDSAASGTAFATGHKTSNGSVAVDKDGKAVKTLLEYAKAAGKATGLVTTSRLTDATPAVFAAHVSARGDEQEVAAQMLETAPEVMMGGGKSNFEAKTRKDQKDLVAEAKTAGYTVVTDKNALAKAKDGKILGLFASGLMPYTIDNDKKAPTLAEMEQKALDILSKDEDGFFAMIEGGRIDHACHANDMPTTAKEVLAFDNAVKLALDFAKKDGQTLVIVTADHETGGLSIGATAQGYTFIAGQIAKQDGSLYESIILDVNWTSLDIAAFMKEHFGISKLTADELSRLTTAYAAEKADRSKNENVFGRVVAAVAAARSNTGWTTRYHSGNDVLILAQGPFAQNFIGHIDNTDIFKLMKQALGL